MLATVLAALAAHGLWIASRVLAPDPFADAVVATLQAPEGQERIAERVRAALPPDASGPLADRAVDVAVARVVTGPRFGDSVAAAIADAHRQVVAERTEGAATDLAGLHPALVAELERIQPGLGALAPSQESLGAVELPGLARLDALPRLGDVGTSQVPAAVAALAALAFVVLALMTSPTRRGTARTAGVALLVLAVLPALARLTAPPLAEAAVEPPELQPIAGRLAAELLADWWLPTALSAGAGLALLVLGAAIRGGAQAPGPRGRR